MMTSRLEETCGPESGEAGSAGRPAACTVAGGLGEYPAVSEERRPARWPGV